MSKTKVDRFADTVTQLLSPALGREERPSTPPLQRLVADRLAELDLSTREASAKSKGPDGVPRISHASLNNMARGDHAWARIKPETVDALADVLDVPPSRIRKAMAESSDAQLPPFRMPPRHDRLNQANRATVTAVADRLLAEQDTADRAHAAVEVIFDAVRRLPAGRGLDDLASMLHMLATQDMTDPDVVEGAAALVEHLAPEMAPKTRRGR